ncbi:MAG TPA: hypothetical protein PLL09_00570 [Flavobacterium sp.]|uniref:PIN domain-containing protein n=2 Tax=Flavobacterium TaxID=237 RepID=UPI0025BCD138|nr:MULTISPECIES: hypothetical protein [unclassified Flavobacterium]HRE76293.1 hypothetical protein [Flavobacterium sp.]
MEISNTNFGNIDSNGGNVNLGNTYVNNVFEGLGQLLIEYREQLKNIETLTNQFKVKTALTLLIELENRVQEIEIDDKNKILGKINFLKGVCKRELPESKTENAAKDFITAYNYFKSDIKIRDRACVEYLNLREVERAVEFADEILLTDEYNVSAWYVKAVTATDLKLFILTIPKVIIEEYNFRLSLIHHIVLTGNLKLFEDLAEYHLTLDIDFPRYKEVTFNALEAWRVATDLAINKVFNDYPLRYINGNNFILEDNPTVKIVFDLLSVYVTKLENTEIGDSILHQQFFLAYFGYLLTNDGDYLKSLKSIFPKLDQKFWFYVFSYCQILNHSKEYEESLKQVLVYETNGGEMQSEVYLFKSALYHLTGRGSEVIDIFSDYLNSIDVIDERNGFNIINAFLNILYKKVDESVLDSQLERIKQKLFKSEQLKSLLEITIKVRYVKNFDTEEIYGELANLQQFQGFDVNWRNLIAENLNTIGKRKEAIIHLENYVDKTQINETLRFFIILLHQQLTDKNDQEKGRYNELLELLKFWRLYSKYPDETLLQFEHNLYTEINDLATIEEIDAYLYSNFPYNEQYILIYLNVLERRKNFEKIKEVSDNITWDIENERFGVTLSVVLMRTKVDVEKGFKILYALASNPNNIVARKNYFASSLVLKEKQFFVRYEKVEIGHWVTYLVGDKKEYLKIERDTGLQKEFIGKKSGEIFTTVTGLSGKMISITIVEILNDAWHLFRMIQEEANNPINELGFESVQMPTNPEDFEAFLKSQFGGLGTKEKEIKDVAMEDYFNYRIGFSEISRSVFRENYINAYLHLTGVLGNRFTTIPSLLTKKITSEQVTVYGLDFSTLLLFFFLEKEFSFEFIHRYSISYLIKNEIDREIVELVNSPSSPMTLQITTQFIRKYDTPEDYNQKRIEFLQSLLDWIERNCDIDLVPEKLNLLPKFDNEQRLDDMMKLLVDNICISDRENFKLITSDTTLFLFSRRGSTFGNIVNPEKYLNAFYPEKCDIEFYRFLLKSNYIGINISLETLKNEFYQYLSNGQNYYNACLENLQYTIHGNPQIIIMLSKFLKELYIMQVLTLEKKNLFAHGILSRAVYGMPREVIVAFNRQLLVEFRLMGKFGDEVISVLRSVTQ